MEWAGILKRNISVAGGDGFNVFLRVRLVDYPDDAINKETAKKIMYEHFDKLNPIPLGEQKVKVSESLMGERPRLARFISQNERYVTYRIDNMGELR